MAKKKFGNLIDELDYKDIVESAKETTNAEPVKEEKQPEEISVTSEPVKESKQKTKSPVKASAEPDAEPEQEVQQAAIPDFPILAGYYIPYEEFEAIDELSHRLRISKSQLVCEILHEGLQKRGPSIFEDIADVSYEHRKNDFEKLSDKKKASLLKKLQKH